MSGTLQIGGLASGLDTKSIIEELMKVERQPLDRLEEQKTNYELKKEALEEINSSLLSLYNSVSKLTLESTFLGKLTSSSNESVVTAKAGAEALIGSYEITVNRLATPTSVKSENPIGASIDETAPLDSVDFRITPTTGTISLSVDGTTYEIFVNTSTDSIDDIVNKINTAVGTSIASYNATDDTFVLSYAGHTIQVGAQGDTSNFWSSVYLEGVDPGETLTSTTHLGAINPSSYLKDLNFSYGTTLTDGYFTINGVTIEVSQDTDTLNSVISKINNSEAGVFAYYDSVEDKLVIKSKTEGPTAISFGSSGDTSNFLEVVQVKNATQDIGTSAEFVIDGFNGGNPITSATNTVTDVIPNVTLTLKGTGTSTITISADIDKAVDAVKDFIEKYNSTVDLLNERLNEVPLKTPTTDDEKKIGILRSDTTLRLTLENIRRMVSDRVEGLPEDLNMLFQIGIDTGAWDSSDIGIEAAKKGHLELDEDKLREVLAQNPEGVAELFDTGTDGIARRLKDYIGSVTSLSGIIKSREDAIDSEVKRLNQEISDWEERLRKIEADYWKKFGTMEQMIAQMNSMSAWLAQQFAGMSQGG